MLFQKIGRIFDLSNCNKMTNLELSQALGFNYDIVGQIFNDGIRDYIVTGINMQATRFQIQYLNIEANANHAMSVKRFKKREGSGSLKK